MKLGQIKILGVSMFIALTSFFSFFIPVMYFNFEFLHYLINNGVGVYQSLLVWTLIGFGFLFVGLVFCGTILHYFIELYDWQTKYDKLIVKGEK